MDEKYHTFRLLHSTHPARDFTRRASDIFAVSRTQYLGLHKKRRARPACGLHLTCNEKIVFDGKMITGRTVVVRGLLPWQVSLPGRRTIYLKGVSLALHGLLAPPFPPKLQPEPPVKQGKIVRYEHGGERTKPRSLCWFLNFPSP
jgi:hypothetical protein